MQADLQTIECISQGAVAAGGWIIANFIVEEDLICIRVRM